MFLSLKIKKENPKKQNKTKLKRIKTKKKQKVFVYITGGDAIK